MRMAKSSQDIAGLRIAINAAVKQTHADVSEGVRDACQALAEAIRSACPRDTGALAGTIAMVDQGEKGFEVRVGSEDVYYAPFVEFGTSRMPAKPFIRPALDEFETKLPQDIEARLNRG